MNNTDKFFEINCKEFPPSSQEYTHEKLQCFLDSPGNIWHLYELLKELVIIQPHDEHYNEKMKKIQDFLDV